MCGIVGYVGREEAVPILIRGLKKLEYRGYDSAGIAVMQEGKIHYEKKKGRIATLQKYVNKDKTLKGTCGIGHTRWATHGEPTDQNAHPHFNEERTIGIVHNGIIENYQELKEKMIRQGYKFQSETDSEVVVHMLDYYNTGNPLETIQKVIGKLRGSYALEILFSTEQDRIYCVRKDSPLVIGKAKDGTYIASDAPAILAYTRDVYYPENEEIAIVTQKDVSFYFEEEFLEKQCVHLDLDENAAEKGSYEHYMMKEIEEQPQAIRTLLQYYQSIGSFSKKSGRIQSFLEQTERILIVACGSAYHAGLTGKYVIESLARIPTEVEVASEFRYRNPIFKKHDLVIVISQSGETADSIAALREAKTNEIPVLAIVNVEGSTIAREADAVIYTLAGPEISVATTKGYLTQLLILYLLAIEIAVSQKQLQKKEAQKLLEELKILPQKIAHILEQKEELQKMAAKYAAREHVFYIGRGIDYTTVLEGALKLKEISYIHAEAYAAGELKHGTIALLEEGTPVIVLNTQKVLSEKIRSNMIEAKSRGAKIYEISFEKRKDMDEAGIQIPEIEELFTSILAIIPLQLLAYYVAVAKGIDVDKPRNLAKSVTVE